MFMPTSLFQLRETPLETLSGIGHSLRSTLFHSPNKKQYKEITLMPTSHNPRQGSCSLSPPMSEISKEISRPAQKSQTLITYTNQSQTSPTFMPTSHNPVLRRP